MARKTMGSSCSLHAIDIDEELDRSGVAEHLEEAKQPDKPDQTHDPQVERHHEGQVEWQNGDQID